MTNAELPVSFFVCCRKVRRLRERSLPAHQKGHAWLRDDQYDLSTRRRLYRDQPVDRRTSDFGFWNLDRQPRILWYNRYVHAIITILRRPTIQVVLATVTFRIIRFLSTTDVTRTRWTRTPWNRFEFFFTDRLWLKLTFLDKCIFLDSM